MKQIIRNLVPETNDTENSDENASTDTVQEPEIDTSDIEN